MPKSCFEYNNRSTATTPDNCLILEWFTNYQMQEAVSTCWKCEVSVELESGNGVQYGPIPLFTFLNVSTVHTICTMTDNWALGILPCFTPWGDIMPHVTSSDFLWKVSHPSSWSYMVPVSPGGPDGSSQYHPIIKGNFRLIYVVPSSLAISTWRCMVSWSFRFDSTLSQIQHELIAV